jgi:hypothetical protein
MPNLDISREHIDLPCRPHTADLGWRQGLSSLKVEFFTKNKRSGVPRSVLFEAKPRCGSRERQGFRQRMSDVTAQVNLER